MRQLLHTVFVFACLGLASCTTPKLPLFSSQRWYVDSYSGNAISTSGLELGFGSEWMVTDTTLIQTPEQMAKYPKLSSYLAKGIAEFSEITVDSIYFYNPHRGLLFVSYHQARPLKPTAEIYLYSDTTPVYSKEYARVFGELTTYIDDDGWENGPTHSVYSNVRYKPHDKQLILLQRIPYNGKDIAIFQICTTKPPKGKWLKDYPPGTFWNTDLGNTNNIESVALFLQSSRTMAVSNLKLSLTNVRNK